MALAVTPFDGLCGFRPLAEIAHFLATVPSLRRLVGDDAAKEFETTVKANGADESEAHVRSNRQALQKAFTSLMNSEPADVEAAAKELVASAKSEGAAFAGEGGPSNGGQELADLIVRLNEQFEGDIGLFVVFFVNYVKLEAGEALFLQADDIHAYLSGGKSAPFRYCRRADLVGKTSSSAWHPPTTSCVRASRPSTKTSKP